MFKKMISSFFFFSFLFSSLFSWSFKASAETWYGFCHATQGNTTYCSDVRLRTSDFDDYCKIFATSLDIYAWKMQYATSVKMLQDMQKERCTKIISGPDAQAKDCYVTTYCTNSGKPTSSITPIGLKVIASNKADGLKQCLTHAKDIYYDYFSANSKNNCYSSASF